MAESQPDEPITQFFGGKEAWTEEDLVPASSLAYLAASGPLRLTDEATGVVLSIDVSGEDRERFLVRGRVALTVARVVDSMTLQSGIEMTLTALRLEDGDQVIVATGGRDQFFPPKPEETEYALPSGSQSNASLLFSIDVTPPNGYDYLVSWIVDPKIRAGTTHWWSSSSYPKVCVNTVGTINAGGTKISYPACAKIYSMGFGITTNDPVVDYDVTGKNLWFNGNRYP